MNTTVSYQGELVEEGVSHEKMHKRILKFSIKDTRKILKIFLLRQLHDLFCDLFKNNINYDKKNYLTECYAMDSKIIQLLIQGIVETGEYTLEGIAYHTHIPFDVIYDAACGIGNHFSITPWVRIIDLYIKLKPDIAKLLIDKLIEIKDKNQYAFLSLLND